MFIGTSTRSKLACAFAAMMLIMTQSLFAQGSGSLKGRVLDRESGEALVGANVLVLETSLGAAADIDGKFTIHQIPAGKRTLRVQYIGYKTITADINITDGGTLEQDFRLAAGVLTGDVVVITAQAKGQLSSINEQLSSNKIVNVVSAEKMQELPDANLAESIGRLPGVSLGRTNGEADKVIVRGLSAQFNKVTIEGIPMVSTSGGVAAGNTNTGSSNYSDRSIDLSMISDDLVKGVELSKSLRADMDADAIGGTINLTLKEAPTGLRGDIQANGGYNALTKYWKNFKVSGSVSDRFIDDAIGARLQLNLEDKTLPSQRFDAGYGPLQTLSINNIDPVTHDTTVTHPYNRQTQASRLTVDNLDRRRAGGSVILDYESNLVDVIFFNLYNQKNDHDNRYDNETNFTATGDNLWSKIYAISDFKTEERTHSLQAKFKLATTELDASVSYSKANYSNPGFDFPFEQVNTPQLGTNSNIFNFAKPSTLITLAGANNPSNFYLRNLDATDNFLNDNTYDGKLDYHVPFKLSDEFTGKISVGGKYHSFVRTNRGNSQYFNMEWGGSGARQDAFQAWVQANINPAYYPKNLNHGISGKYFTQSGYNPPKFLNGDYTLDPWSYSPGLLNEIGQAYYDSNAVKYYTDGPQTYNSKFDDAEKLRAGYLMGEFNLGKDLTIVPGVRYEQLQGSYSAYVVYTNNNNLNGLAGQTPVWREINQTHQNYFPSVNAKYKVSEDVQLVGAYYSSAARPNFSDVSPLVDYGVNNNVAASSNPFLKPAIAQNYDLGVSLFSNNVGLFSVNGFYKQLTDLVYSIPFVYPYRYRDIVQAPSDILSRLPSTSYWDTSWFAKGNQNTYTSVPINNPEKAFVRGLEFSWQTHLWYLPGVLSGIVLDLNYTVMSSHTFYPYFDANSVVKDTVWNAAHTRVKNIDYYVAYRTRPGRLVNMPNATYNIIAGWDYLGFSSRVSFRYQYTTLTSLDSRYAVADAYYDNVLLVDVSLKQKLIENLSIFANFTNIGAHVDNYYYQSPNGPLPTSEQTYGFNAQFGLSYAY